MLKELSVAACCGSCKHCYSKCEIDDVVEYACVLGSRPPKMLKRPRRILLEAKATNRYFDSQDRLGRWMDKNRVRPDNVCPQHQFRICGPALKKED